MKVIKKMKWTALTLFIETIVGIILVDTTPKEWQKLILGAGAIILLLVLYFETLESLTESEVADKSLLDTMQKLSEAGEKLQKQEIINVLQQIKNMASLNMSSGYDMGKAAKDSVTQEQLIYAEKSGLIYYIGDEIMII